MRVLDLFSGIGGFSLGLERAGMETVAFCEIDENCRKVLTKHWPKIPILKNIKKNSCFGDARQYLYGQPHDESCTRLIEKKIDLVCGGFPCQDISIAGHQEGIEGEKSGLWKEFKRVIKEVKPRYAIIENVANLRSKGLNQVIKDLWSVGYACEWHIISARSVGAPHLRERVWIIAYPESVGNRRKCGGVSKESQETISEKQRKESKCETANVGTPTNTTNSHNFRFWKPFASEEIKQEWWTKTSASVGYWKEAQSIVRGVDDGLSRGMDKPRKERIKQLGNAVVPQIPEIIGRAIMDYEKEHTDIHTKPE